MAVLTFNFWNSRNIKEHTTYDYTHIHFYTFFCSLGNGYITTSTLKEILKELDDKLTSDELDMMIAEIDSDGSGTVDFDGKYKLLSNFLFFPY